MPMGDYDSEFTNPEFDNYLTNPSNPRYNTQPVGQPVQGPDITNRPPTPPGNSGGGSTPPPPPPPAGGTPPPSSAGSPPPGDPVAFIRSWQASHQANEGIAPLADAYKAAGFGGRFMYGDTASNNELMVNGQKYKVLSGEDNPATAGWYRGENDSAPGSGGSGFSTGGSSFQMGPAMFASGLGSHGEASNLYDLLMSRARQDVSPDRTDPIIRRASDSNSAQLQRAERNYEAQVAERAGPHANIGSERRLGMEHVGQASAEFENQLMGQERSARRQEIQQAPQVAAGLLTQQQQMALQEELQRLNLGQNESQFGRNLGQRAYEFDANDAYRYSPFAPGS